MCLRGEHASGAEAFEGDRWSVGRLRRGDKEPEWKVGLLL